MDLNHGSGLHLEGILKGMGSCEGGPVMEACKQGPLTLQEGVLDSLTGIAWIVPCPLMGRVAKAAFGTCPWWVACASPWGVGSPALAEWMGDGPLFYFLATCVCILGGAVFSYCRMILLWSWLSLGLGRATVPWETLECSGNFRRSG